MNKKTDILLWLVTSILLVYTHYLIFMYVPNERIMGAVQRVFYFHVGSAIACYCAFAIVFIAGLAYLANRNRKADVWAEAAGEVGFIFCTIVLISGMIWGQAAWGIWFNWEPRLVTFLLLWLIFLGFNLLRFFGDPGRIPQHSAVLGIIGAVTVPIMVFSIKLLPPVAQLHPQVLEKGGIDPAMRFALAIAIVALVLLQFLLVRLRVKIGTLERKNYGTNT